MSTNAKPYKETLNLPVTRFEMKANLTAREPKIQARWRELDLYGQIRAARSGRERKVLHDGPPMPTARSIWGTCSTRCSRTSSFVL